MAEACFLDIAAMAQLLIQLEMCVCVIVRGTERSFGGYKSLRAAKLEADSTNSTVPTRLNSHISNPSANSQLQPY